MPDNPPPGTAETLLLWLQLAITWFAGEAGRAAIAGAAGGLIRWLMSERRRIRDGILAVVAGLLFARYLSPIMQALITTWIGDLGDGDAVRDTAAFAAGLGGMSVAKIILAVIDAQAAKLRLGDGGGHE